MSPTLRSASDGRENASPSVFRHLERDDFAAKPFVLLGDAVLSYGALHDLVRRTAVLFALSGIAAGDRIVICSPHDIEIIALYLAAMRLGVTPALIDPHSSPQEATTLVGAARARAAFVDQRLLPTLSAASELLPGGQLFTIMPVEHRGAPTLFNAAGMAAIAETDAGPESYPALLRRHHAPPPLPPLPTDDTSAFILFTSGTTSRPKGVEVSHLAVRSHMATMHRQYGYDTGSRILNGLPLHHSDGINHGAVNAIAAGATLVRSGAFSVQQLPAILGLVRRHRITHMVTVPTVLALAMRLEAEHDGAFGGGDFRFVSSTAGPLEPALWRQFESRFATLIVNSYGLTETICEGFYCGPDDATRRIGTIGKPIDIDVRIVDAKGRDAAVGEMGELLLRGSCVMKGYFDAPDETAAVLVDGWLHSGDLVVRDADGFFSITGRKKNVVISGGVNVYPEDVSRLIQRLPGVADVVTLGVADDTWGERVVSCVVATCPGAISSDSVIAHCREHGSREKVPSRVFVVDEMPRGPAGKIVLPQVRQIIAERIAAEHDRASGAPLAGGSGGDTRQQVLDIAATCFRTPVAELSLDSEPESTGGWNSLAHMDFLLAIESAFGIRMAPSDMLAIETLGDAVDFVDSALARSAAAADAGATAPELVR